MLRPAFHYIGYIETTAEQLWEAMAIQMAPPQRMLAALKRMGIKTP
jgi:hypothetical protein